MADTDAAYRDESEENEEATGAAAAEEGAPESDEEAERAQWSGGEADTDEEDEDDQYGDEVPTDDDDEIGEDGEDVEEEAQDDDASEDCYEAGSEKGEEEEEEPDDDDEEEEEEVTKIKKEEEEEEEEKGEGESDADLDSVGLYDDLLGFDEDGVGSSKPSAARGDGVTETKKKPFFETLGLLPRVLKGMKVMKMEKPTLIQQKALPLMLQKKNVIMLGKPGAGKTMSYVVYIAHTVLRKKQIDETPRIRAVVVVPSDAVAHAVHKSFSLILKACNSILACTMTNSLDQESVEKALSKKPDILIGTPTFFLKFRNSFNLSGVDFLVLEDFDQTVGAGLGAATARFAESLPPTCQGFLATSSTNTELAHFRVDILRAAAIVHLRAPPTLPNNVTEHNITLHAYNDKFLVIYAMLRLRMVHGKLLIFAATVDRCIRLKLLLKRFEIPCEVLNCDLPLNARQRTVEMFNKNAFPILITNFRALRSEPMQPAAKKPRQIGPPGNKNGMGLFHFRNVDAVLNFDCPLHVAGYLSIARTCVNEGKKLTVITLHVPKYDPQWTEIAARRKAAGTPIPFFHLNTEAVEGFRYRVEDVKRSIRFANIRDERVAAIRGVVNSSAEVSSFLSKHKHTLPRFLKSKSKAKPRRISPISAVPSYLFNPLTADLPDFMPDEEVEAAQKAAEEAAKAKKHGKRGGRGASRVRGTRVPAVRDGKGGALWVWTKSTEGGASESGTAARGGARGRGRGRGGRGGARGGGGRGAL
ncbi:atp-dependent rna helicase dbp9 [Pelomyxa schiedti]|nr:atp-dependent rna helicase dbp9 [Pelomyxa schiedti]